MVVVAWDDSFDWLHYMWTLKQLTVLYHIAHLTLLLFLSIQPLTSQTLPWYGIPFGQSTERQWKISILKLLMWMHDAPLVYSVSCQAIAG